MLVLKRTCTLENLGRFLQTLALLSFIAVAQGLNATELLEQKDQELKEVASLVRRNAGLCGNTLTLLSPLPSSHKIR